MVDIDPARPPTRQIEIRPGMPVLAGDDQIGKVDRLIVDPSSGELLGVVVRRGVLLHHDVFIPADTITAEQPDGIATRLSVDELNELPEFDPSRFPEQPEDRPKEASRAASRNGADGDHVHLAAERFGQLRAASSGRPLRSGQLVKALDGDVGRLDLVLVEPLTRKVEALVVRQGRFLARDTIIPAKLVSEIHRDWIQLSVPRSELADLPEYRPDEEIGLDILDRLWYEAPDLRPGDLQYVEVHVRNGIVELTGHTSTEEARHRIVEIVRTVRGVRGVEDYLDTFESLVAAVREASKRQPSQVIAAGPPARSR
jgi:uncharacterized protein YrrD